MPQADSLYKDYKDFTGNQAKLAEINYDSAKVSPQIPNPCDYTKKEIVMEILKISPHKAVEAVISDATKIYNFISNKKDQ